MSVPTIGKFGDAPVAQTAPSKGPARDPAPSAALKPQPQQASQPSQAEVQQALQAIKEKLGSLARDNLQFSVDDSTGQVVARITDGKTGDLIRQIPSEEAIAIAKDLDRLKGLLLRQQA